MNLRSSPDCDVSQLPRRQGSRVSVRFAQEYMGRGPLQCSAQCSVRCGLFGSSADDLRAGGSNAAGSSTTLTRPD